MCSSRLSAGGYRFWSRTVLLLMLAESASAVFVRQRGKWVKMAEDDSDRMALQSKIYSKRFQQWWKATTEEYDKSIRPNFGGNNVVVKVDIKFLGISSVEEQSMKYTAELFVYQQWRDPRMSFNRSWFGQRDSIHLPYEAAQVLWTPDTYVRNALQSSGPSEGSFSHPQHFQLSTNGTVSLSQRISIIAQCYFDLVMYPFDYQSCGLHLSSYGLTIDDLVYDSVIDEQSANLPAVALADFYASDYSVRVVNQSWNGDVFSEVVFCVGLKRRSGYCFLNLFIPATAVVTSSWTSLWLEDQTQFSDIFSILLSIIFLSFSFNTVMPRVSYIKVMDIYLGACFIFAFLSLVKLIIVKMLHRQIQKRSKRSSINMLKSHPLLSDTCSTSSTLAAVDRTSAGTESIDLQVDLLKYLHLDHPLFQTVHDCVWLGAKVFHIISQVFLPIAFGAFGFFYFAIFPNIDYSSTTC